MVKFIVVWITQFNMKYIYNKITDNIFLSHRNKQQDMLRSIKHNILLFSHKYILIKLIIEYKIHLLRDKSHENKSMWWLSPHWTQTFILHKVFTWTFHIEIQLFFHKYICMYFQKKITWKKFYVQNESDYLHHSFNMRLHYGIDLQSENK